MPRRASSSNLMILLIGNVSFRDADRVRCPRRTATLLRWPHRTGGLITLHVGVLTTILALTIPECKARSRGLSPLRSGRNNQRRGRGRPTERTCTPSATGVEGAGGSGGPGGSMGDGGPGCASRRHTSPHASTPNATGVEGAGGPGCGTRGRRRGVAGLRVDAPSEARGADGSQAGRRPPAHTAAGPSGAQNTSGATQLALWDPTTAGPRQNSPSTAPPAAFPRQNSPSTAPPAAFPRKNSPSGP